MAERRARGSVLAALAVGSAGLVVVALQTASPTVPVVAPAPSGSVASGVPAMIAPSSPSASASTSPVVSAVTASTLEFAQDALQDPVVTGRVTGDPGVRVAAEVLQGGSWVEEAATVTGPDGAFSITLSFGHAEVRTDAWRLVAEGVASPQITVRRLGVASATVRPVTRADVTYSWREGCPVHYSTLRLLDINHYGFDGKMHRGQLVVQAKVVDRVVALLQHTIDNRFPIRTMRTIEAFKGSDDASAAADNTSAFNCRLTTGGTRWSDHAFGVAIDINPVENPYIDGQILPPAGRDYLDRTNLRPGMLTEGSPVIVFARANGWDWLSPHDYQHLEVIGAR
nr:M15 family metallopeptidase [Propionibacterium sp.]